MGTTRYNKEQLYQSISSSESWRQVCIKLGLRYAGGNVQCLKKKAEELGFDVSHFKGRGWNIGGKARNEIPLEKCLQKGFYIKADTLKKKLLKAGQIEEKCSECQIGNEWNGKLLVLELDHIDGDVSNNERTNLRLLCPNCHSQTETFRGRKRAGVVELADRSGLEPLALNKRAGSNPVTRIGEKNV